MEPQKYYATNLIRLIVGASTSLLLFNNAISKIILAGALGTIFYNVYFEQFSQNSTNKLLR